MRVILVDDHALVRKGIEELLRSRGVQVVASVGSGEEGLRRARELHADVILLDVRMPGMGGIETLRQLRASGVETPVVMLTMSREESDLGEALRAGARGYLLKDIDPEELAPALQAALSGEKTVARDLVGALARLIGDDAGARALRATHRELRPRVEEIAALAARLDTLPAPQARQALLQLRDFFLQALLPHEREEEGTAYPLVAGLLAGEDPTGPLIRTHYEIARLVRLFARLVDRLSPDGPLPDEVRDLRRTLYGLHAILTLHFAQEEELYLLLSEPRA